MRSWDNNQAAVYHHGRLILLATEMSGREKAHCTTRTGLSTLSSTAEYIWQRTLAVPATVTVHACFTIPL
jgi:hypothetical protein